MNKFFSFLSVLFIGILAFNPVQAQYFWEREAPPPPRQEVIYPSQQNQQTRAAIPHHLQNRQRGGDPQEITRRQQAPGLPQTAYREEQAQPRGFFDWLFNSRPRFEERPEAYPNGNNTPVFVDPDQGSNVGGRRTICVRLCDGAFMPISTGRSSRSDRDGDICAAQCPGAETRVFALNGDRLEDAVSTSGESYSSLPNALKFRAGFVPSCACRPQGKSWAEYAATMEDPTMRKGDKVLTVDQAKRMSLAPQLAKNLKDIDAAERDRANYILKSKTEESVPSLVFPEVTGDVRVIQVERQAQNEEPEVRLTPIQQLIKDRMKKNEGVKSGGLDEEKRGG